MGFDYFVFYTEASVVCILILLILFINARMYSTKQEKQVWFDRAVFAFIAYFISDDCWAGMLSGVITRIVFLSYSLIYQLCDHKPDGLYVVYVHGGIGENDLSGKPEKQAVLPAADDHFQPVYQHRTAQSRAVLVLCNVLYFGNHLAFREYSKSFTVD